MSNRARRRPPLSTLLAYRNPDVITRFRDAWEVSRKDADLVFSDLMRFSWLTTRVDYHISPVPIVDEMWHTFLAFTRPYTQWSQQMFGEFFHHTPTTENEKRAREQLGTPGLVAEIERGVATTLAHLGEQVALRWYVLYFDKYSDGFFREARRSTESAFVWFPPALLQRARDLNRGVCV